MTSCFVMFDRKKILACVNRVADWDKCVGILCHKEQTDAVQSEVGLCMCSDDVFFVQHVV